jgi:hypothetical protein
MKRKKVQIAILSYSDCCIYILEKKLKANIQTEEIEKILQKEGYKLSEINWMISDNEIEINYK